MGAFDAVMFSSGQNALEIDNISATATPLPATITLFASGVGLVGWMSRRKRKQAPKAQPSFAAA
jgi:hypothetical protein